MYGYFSCRLLSLIRQRCSGKVMYQVKYSSKPEHMVFLLDGAPLVSCFRVEQFTNVSQTFQPKRFIKSASQVALIIYWKLSKYPRISRYLLRYSTGWPAAILLLQVVRVLQTVPLDGVFILSRVSDDYHPFFLSRLPQRCQWRSSAKWTFWSLPRNLGRHWWASLS